jgi:hypothetical protein
LEIFFAAGHDEILHPSTCGGQIFSEKTTEANEEAKAA